MLPNSFVQNIHYDENHIPKRHLDKYNTENINFWNALNALNFKNPKSTIYLDFFLVDIDFIFYGIDVKLNSDNTELLNRLAYIYKRYYYRGYFRIPHSGFLEAATLYE